MFLSTNTLQDLIQHMIALQARTPRVCLSIPKYPHKSSWRAHSTSRAAHLRITTWTSLIPHYSWLDSTPAPLGSFAVLTPHTSKFLQTGISLGFFGNFSCAVYIPSFESDDVFSIDWLYFNQSATCWHFSEIRRAIQSICILTLNSGCDVKVRHFFQTPG